MNSKPHVTSRISLVQAHDKWLFQSSIRIYKILKSGTGSSPECWRFHKYINVCLSNWRHRRMRPWMQQHYIYEYLYWYYRCNKNVFGKSSIQNSFSLPLTEGNLYWYQHMRGYIVILARPFAYAFYRKRSMRNLWWK